MYASHCVYRPHTAFHHHSLVQSIHVYQFRLRFSRIQLSSHRRNHTSLVTNEFANRLRKKFHFQQISVEYCRSKNPELPIIVNPLDAKGNYSATSNNTKLVHWLLMGGLLHLVQQGVEGGAWAGCSPAQSPPRCT